LDENCSSFEFLRTNNLNKAFETKYDIPAKDMKPKHMYLKFNEEICKIIYESAKNPINIIVRSDHFAIFDVIL
jgi:hypothetical protein